MRPLLIAPAVVLIPALVTLCLAGPLLAQSQETPAVPEEEEGFSLMEEGAKLFFKGIMQEMEPAIDDLRTLTDDMEPALRQFVQDMGPALTDLMAQVDDITRYHAPEILPNGDIIMRRKPPKPSQDENKTPKMAPEMSPEPPEIEL